MSFYVSKKPVVVKIKSLNNPIVEVFARALVGQQVTPYHPLAGVTIILGSTNSGKSEFVGNLSANLRERDELLVGQFNVLEPSVHKYAYQLSAPSMITIESVVEQLAEALAHGVDTFFIDSFRVFQYDLGGSAVSGGMSTGTFKMLTQLSELCYHNGVAVIVPLNPNVKEDLLEYTARNIEGSVHNIINLDTNTFSSRDSDRDATNLGDVADFVVKVFDTPHKHKRVETDYSLYGSRPIYTVDVNPDPLVTTVFDTADIGSPSVSQITEAGEVITLDDDSVVQTKNIQLIPRNTN